MKQFLITLLLLAFSTTLFTDKFVVKSFKRIDNKIMLNKDKRTDDNDDLCAIVLVRTSLVGLGMSASTPVVGNINWRQGDYWVYLSPGTRMIKFFKKGFEALEYTFPQRIEKGKFYILNLEYRRTNNAVAAVNTMGFVVINSNPSGASVWLNGEETGEQTPFSRALNEGYYRFTLKKELYKDYKGDFSITPNQTINRKIEMAPNYGALQVNSSPEEGAEIFIDDESTGKKTPALVDRLKTGNHKLTLKKTMYATFTQTFAITAGQTITLKPILKPVFGNVTIQADTGDEIYIDRQKKGTGNYTGRVSQGQHLLEIKKNGYYAQSLTLNVAAGQPLSQTIHLKMKTGTLQVQSTPLQTNIFLNGKAYGQTPRFIPGLMVGTYTLRLQKQGYATVEKQVAVTENKTTSIKETLPNAVSIKISSKPEGAKLYVDGQYKGITPTTLSLSFEQHSFKLQKKGYNTFKISRTPIQTTNSLSLSFELKVIHPTVYTSKVAGIEMIFVQGGTFQMGSPKGIGNDNEHPQHKITVNSFYIGKYEITQKQWKAVMGNNPSHFKGDNLPVENVSWNDIQKFLQKLNTKTGKHYRLPTEAEWEYAAQGGDKSHDYIYSGSNNIEKVAWYTGNSKDHIHPVGTKTSNELGIYDMSGNVWEWCNDWYDKKYYDNSPQNNPQGPSSGKYRVLRGGSWLNFADYCRVSNRLWFVPYLTYYYVGFRVVHPVQK